jgi:tetratricopeptide (TPR) repeat protein/uncharacterized coiled-coil protein SlyX
VCCFLFIVAYATSFKGYCSAAGGRIDTSMIANLNKQAYDNRLTAPDQTIKQALKALVFSNKINFPNGAAEANRVIGIGYGYLSQPDTALTYYLKALTIFENTRNLVGMAKVDNNIGNLYKESDYDKSIEYFNETLRIANKIENDDLKAMCYLNFGNIYYRKNKFQMAFDYYTKSNELFTKLNNVPNMIQCQQNLGVIYYNWRHDPDKALTLLLEANRQAKEKDLNTTVASINLTIIKIYKDKNKFDEADKYLNEGLVYAELVKSVKLIYDYKLSSYELKLKRNDYKGALVSLQDIYHIDSVKYKKTESIRLNLLNVQFNQSEIEHRNEKIKAEQSQQQILFWASVFVAGLLFVVILLLISNVNRKAKTNKRLTELNAKISEQKENLNQINHHLEEIIDERTKDLQVKNKKLADYSLHLSHQIRGPIATLKGLLNLEKDNLIQQEECIKLMNKCVSEIDDNIIDMSGMLHESIKKG